MIWCVTLLFVALNLWFVSASVRAAVLYRKVQYVVTDNKVIIRLTGGTWNVHSIWQHDLPLIETPEVRHWLIWNDVVFESVVIGTLEGVAHRRDIGLLCLRAHEFDQVACLLRLLGDGGDGTSSLQ